MSWDGSEKNYRQRRALRVSRASATRLLRGARLARCAACGNIVEWQEQVAGAPVALHPQELPARTVTSADRWHVDAGLAHQFDGGALWCRIHHHALCPAVVDRQPGDRLLEGLRRRLAVNSRRLMDSDRFTPRAVPPPSPAPRQEGTELWVVHLLHVRYLAPCRPEHVRCVAFTRARRRCPQPVPDPEAPSGKWTLALADRREQGDGQLPFGASWLALYDLTGLSYAEQLRWYVQRCTAHVRAPTAADAAMTEWVRFDPRLHRQHITSHLLPPLPQPAGGGPR